MHRTTIELDEKLVEQAKLALGTATIKATVEEALRRSVENAEAVNEAAAESQRAFLGSLADLVDLDVLGSDEMWQ